MSDHFILTPYFLDQAIAELEGLVAAGWVVNRPALPESSRQQRMASLYEPLAEQVEAAVRAGKRPVSIAGDCCTTLGVMAGLQRAGLQPRLIWFDAHGDFNTWETTPSGFLGGMPLAMLVGRGEQTITGALRMQPLPEQRVILTDARDLDPLEATAVRNAEITHLPDVQTLLETPLPDDPLYIHFDVDVINLDEAPAMSYPAPGGPSVATLARVFGSLAGSGQVVAVSMSCWNPALDTDGRSRGAALRLLDVLLA